MSDSDREDITIHVHVFLGGFLIRVYEHTHPCLLAYLSTDVCVWVAGENSNFFFDASVSHDTSYESFSMFFYVKKLMKCVC